MSAGLSARERIRAATMRATNLSTVDHAVLAAVLLCRLEDLPGGAHLVTVAQAVETAVAQVEREAAAQESAAALPPVEEVSEAAVGAIVDLMIADAELRGYGTPGGVR